MALAVCNKFGNYAGDRHCMVDKTQIGLTTSGSINLHVVLRYANHPTMRTIYLVCPVRPLLSSPCNDNTSNMQLSLHATHHVKTAPHPLQCYVISLQLSPLSGNALRRGREEGGLREEGGIRGAGWMRDEGGGREGVMGWMRDEG